MPWMAEKFGRDVIGIAGGSDITETVSACTPLVKGRAAGNGRGSLLFIPNDKAERLVLSSTGAERTGDTFRSSSGCRDGPVEWSVCRRAGSRGGIEGGRASVSSWMEWSRVEETLSGPDGALLWYFGFSAEKLRCVACLVGSGGSSQSPQAGAFILPDVDSLDFDLEGPVDVPDTLERTEEVDSKESRLELCSVGRLGGKAGHG